MASNSSSVWWKRGFTTSIPALLTMMSRPPKASTVACTAAACSAAEVTSHFTARQFSPNSSAVSLTPPSSMSEIITWAPRSMKRAAMALPRPWAPPVTNARLPSSSAIAHLLVVGGRCGTASPSPASPATEGWIEKAPLLWRGLQVAVRLSQKVPLHGPPHLEGADGPLQDRSGELLEPPQPVADRVLVHVEGFGGGLHAEAVLDEGGDGLEDGRRPPAQLLERPQVAGDEQLAELVLGGHRHPQRQVLEPVHTGPAEPFCHLEDTAGGGEGRLDGGQVGRGAHAHDARAPGDGRCPRRHPHHVAFQHVHESMVPDRPAGSADGPDELGGGGSAGRAPPESDVAQIRGEVEGRPQAPDLGRGHRPEDQPPEELRPLALAVAGDVDLGVAVHGRQPDADGIGQRPQQLDHLQRHGRGAARRAGRLDDELPDLVDG